MRLTLKDVEARVAHLGGRSFYDRDFIFELLTAYGRTKSNITRLRSTSPSSLNIADNPSTEVAQKNIVYFKELPPSSEDELLHEVERLSASSTVVRFNTRFVIVTDYQHLLAKDIKTGETLTIPVTDIGDHFTFFLPWAGMEKAQYTAEAHADVKAAERMAKLFDELLEQNPEALRTTAARHSLNVFFTRLLFCFFAEDTGVFPAGLFTESIASLTQPDGSDMQEFLNAAFRALDTEDPAKKPAHLRRFPYVNGRLFTTSQVAPKFNRKARDLLLESGKLQWGEINPDIFGSMFQAVVSPDQRSEMGQHYTSVPNILKTIEPLFLDGLREEFDRRYNSVPRLEALLDRIAKIKIFDPAAGSGNFLVIAYKELRRLEHAILERLAELDQKHATLFTKSRINIENFYGIEIDDFASEIAILSLWLAKHQMNQEFLDKFGVSLPLIPLKETGSIHTGNATRIEWNRVCPNDGSSEIYLISNPPYKGSSEQTPEMKADFAPVFGRRLYSKNLDYVALWFVKGADYIRGTRAQLAFVSTNSVSQGQHVALLFPPIFSMGIEIGYAYTSFKWENRAKRNAGVTVVVINLRNKSNAPKFIVSDDVRITAKNVNGYLADGPDVFVGSRRSRYDEMLPHMSYGSKPADGGSLFLSPREKQQILKLAPEAAPYLRRIVGSREYIDGTERYCIWVEPEDSVEAMKVAEIRARAERVAKMRRASRKAATQKLAAVPWRFAEVRYRPTNAILVPRHSSERREYIPMGYLGPETIISDAASAVYDAEPWVFALLTSKMHMAWTRAVAGALEDRIRYSNTIVYNNFPVPSLSSADKNRLTAAALRVLDVREYHSELTLEDLYDPDKMPQNLRLAHWEVDDLVDSLYRRRGFASDEERLSLLFNMYSRMIEAEAKK